MKHYAVVYFPKIDKENLQKFRKKYDPLWNVISPHITIVSPFSEIAEEQILEHLNFVTATLKPFQVHLNGLVKSFDHCLFLLVQEGKEEVCKIHDALYKGILASLLRCDIPFIPHMTLGVFSTKENQLDDKLYKKALMEANEIDSNYNCIFNSVSLIKGDGVLPAKIIKTFKLE